MVLLVVVVVVVGVRAIYAIGFAVSCAPAGLLKIIRAKGIRTMALAQVTRGIALVGEGCRRLPLVCHRRRGGTAAAGVFIYAGLSLGSGGGGSRAGDFRADVGCLDGGVRV